MENYFDFEEASGQPEPGLSAHSSCVLEYEQGDQTDCFESLLLDKAEGLPTNQSAIQNHGADTTSVPISDRMFIFSDEYPLQRPKQPCDFCKRMGLDCFIAQRGALLHGCTCCINLFRECSFTHEKTPGVWMATLKSVGEDVPEANGALIGKKVMRSIPGAYAFEESQRRNGTRFGREAIKILKTWLTAHAQHPYPTDQEKEDLEHLTGLKKGQIANWLANARRRGKVPSTTSDTTPYPGAIDIPHARPQDLPEWPNMNPMERWKQSPPENEPAAITDIAKAVTASPYPSGRNSSSSSLNRSRQSSSHHHTSSNDDSNMSMFQAPSDSSFGTGLSGLSSVSSLHSGISRGSLKSMEKKERRRRRRVPPIKLNEAKKSRNDRIFQCTFCTDSFPSKYDWTRHEKSLHLALERWTCAPLGAIEEVNGVRRCAFCDVTNPSPVHLETHNYSACEEKTMTERTFYRKDHLRQHLKLLHGCAYNARMDNWKLQTTQVNSRCGFCPTVFTTWQQRADHLAAHFRNGADMRQWEGSWGFEPFIEKLVENEMPPYLISYERMTMDPFVATGRTSSSSSALDSAQGCPWPSPAGQKDQLRQDSNCWRRCEGALSQHIRSELEAGRKPTDAALQTTARLIIYGDDDPWNQSPADNRQWLALVKKQNGLDNGEGIEEEPPKQANGERVTRLEQLPINPPYCIPGGLRRNGKAEQSFASGPASASGSQAPDRLPTHASLGNSSVEAAIDQIDFNTLDLSAIDDSLDVSKVDLDAYMSPNARLGNAPEPGDIFGSQGMDLDDSALVVDQLAQYSSSFNASVGGHTGL